MRFVAAVEKVTAGLGRNSQRCGFLVACFTAIGNMPIRRLRLPCGPADLNNPTGNAQAMVRPKSLPSLRPVLRCNLFCVSAGSETYRQLFKIGDDPCLSQLLSEGSPASLEHLETRLLGMGNQTLSDAHSARTRLVGYPYQVVYACAP